MIILIGGASQTGKTLLAQGLLEEYKWPYLSIDHLKMGLYRVGNCGFTPTDSTQHIAEHLWPMLRGIIMTAVENRQNLIIEGAYLLPQNINKLTHEYLDNVISLYLGFSDEYIQKHLQDEILRNRCAIEYRAYEEARCAAEFISENQYIKSMCSEHNAKYFEIENNYINEIDLVYSWIRGRLC
ncbi:MAG: zeta toxin family protein [Defluviitaleaceae bacterium]|nr:zeta toxin family protein [Defluviitaleaceae bacterium]